MDIEPVNCVRNKAWFDSMLSMEAHQNKVCSSGLHNLRRIRKYLSQDCLVTLIHASSSQVGWTIAIASCMASRSVKFENYMQRVQNAAARIALILTLVNSAI